MKPPTIDPATITTARKADRATTESTTTGKIHGGFGILCEFTNREACEETLSAGECPF